MLRRLLPVEFVDKRVRIAELFCFAFNFQCSAAHLARLNINKKAKRRKQTSSVAKKKQVTIFDAPSAMIPTTKKNDTEFSKDFIKKDDLVSYDRIEDQDNQEQEEVVSVARANSTVEQQQESAFVESRQLAQPVDDEFGTVEDENDDDDSVTVVAAAVQQEQKPAFIPKKVPIIGLKKPAPQVAAASLVSPPSPARPQIVLHRDPKETFSKNFIKLAVNGLCVHRGCIKNPGCPINAFCEFAENPAKCRYSGKCRMWHLVANLTKASVTRHENDVMTEIRQLHAEYDNKIAAAKANKTPSAAAATPATAANDDDDDDEDDDASLMQAVSSSGSFADEQVENALSRCRPFEMSLKAKLEDQLDRLRGDGKDPSPEYIVASNFIKQVMLREIGSRFTSGIADAFSMQKGSLVLYHANVIRGDNDMVSVYFARPTGEIYDSKDRFLVVGLGRHTKKSNQKHGRTAFYDLDYFFLYPEFKYIENNVRSTVNNRTGHNDLMVVKKSK